MNKIIHTRDGQPATGSPNTALRIIINIIMINETNVRNIPKPEAMDIGVSEKLIIPSIAYFNSPQKLHDVSPAIRFTFSYSIHLVLKPIHPKIPLEKRLYSHIATMLSTISFFHQSEISGSVHDVGIRNFVDKPVKFAREKRPYRRFAFS